MEREYKLGEMGRGRTYVHVLVEEDRVRIRKVETLDVYDPCRRFAGTEEEVTERVIPRPAELLRINTMALGRYHRYRSGDFRLFGDGAFVVAEGWWASGAAGNLMDAPDVLVGFKAGRPAEVVAIAAGHVAVLGWVWDGHELARVYNPGEFVVGEARDLYLDWWHRVFQGWGHPWPEKVLEHHGLLETREWGSWPKVGDTHELRPGAFGLPGDRRSPKATATIVAVGDEPNNEKRVVWALWRLNR